MIHPLACDASPYGLGTILFENDELPIAFALCSLAPAEKNYSQIDKEALAIIFGVKHFHQYLFGRHFMIKSITNLCNIFWERERVFL